MLFVSKDDEITDLVLYRAIVIGLTLNRKAKRLEDMIRYHLTSSDPISICVHVLPLFF